MSQEIGRAGASPCFPLLRQVQGSLVHSSTRLLRHFTMLSILPLLNSLNISQDTLYLGAQERTVFAHQFVFYPCHSLLAVVLCSLHYPVPSQTRGNTNSPHPKSFLRIAFIYLHLSCIEIQALPLLHTRQKVLIVHKNYYYFT